MNKSTSMPSTVLPSAARNSFGAYVASVPIMIMPALWIFSGNIDFRSVLALTDTDGTWLVPDPGSPLRELEPQALNAKVPSAAMVIAVFVCIFTTALQQLRSRIDSASAGLGGYCHVTTKWAAVRRGIGIRLQRASG